MENMDNISAVPTQVGGGGLDLAQAVLHPGLLVNVGQADGGHPHDGVHWRSYVVVTYRAELSL